MQTIQADHITNLRARETPITHARQTYHQAKDHYLSLMAVAQSDYEAKRRAWTEMTRLGDVREPNYNARFPEVLDAAGHDTSYTTISPPEA